MARADHLDGDGSGASPRRSLTWRSRRNVVRLRHDGPQIRFEIRVDARGHAGQAPASSHPSARRSPARRSGGRAAARRGRRAGVSRSRRPPAARPRAAADDGARRIGPASGCGGTRPCAPCRRLDPEVTIWTGRSRRRSRNAGDGLGEACATASSVAGAIAPSGNAHRQLVVLALVAHVDGAREAPAAGAMLPRRTTRSARSASAAKASATSAARPRRGHQPRRREVGAQVGQQQAHGAQDAGIARHQHAADLELAASRAACSGPAPPKAISV